jgi:hypothetical protein
MDGGAEKTRRGALCKPGAKERGFNRSELGGRGDGEPDDMITETSSSIACAECTRHPTIACVRSCRMCVGP